MCQPSSSLSVMIYLYLKESPNDFPVHTSSFTSLFLHSSIQNGCENVRLWNNFYVSGDKICGGHIRQPTICLERKVMLHQLPIIVFQLIFFPGDWILYRRNTQYRSSKPTKQNVQWQKYMGCNHELCWLSEYISHDRNESTSSSYIFIAHVQTAGSLFGTW